jgi:hypothetical protein
VHSPSHSSAQFKHPTQPLVPSTDCPFYAPRPLKPDSEGKSFLRAGTGTFSGFKSGAFNVVERSVQPAVAIINSDIVINGEEENAVVSEIAMGENYDNGIEIGGNIEDDICNTENSIHGFDDGMDDIDYNVTDGQNSGSDNMEESFMIENNENFPTEIDDESNKENNAITERDRDTQSSEHETVKKKKSDGKKAPRVINVNYYGNLKFVALKVKSSRPRPLDEKDYGVSSDSHILDLENDNEEEGDER